MDLAERKDLKEYPDNRDFKECRDLRGHQDFRELPDHRGRKAYPVRRDLQEKARRMFAWRICVPRCNG